MKEEVQVFNHPQFGMVRVSTKGNKVMFCLSDVCKSLGIGNASDLKKRLQKRGVVIIDTPTQNQHGATVMQQMTYIDEPNLYRCIFQSRKAEAVQFQDWVFEEVLPQIRQTGGYIPIKEDEDDNELLSRAFIVARRTLEEKSKLLEAQAPKVEYCNEVLLSEDCVTTTQIAKQFGISAIALNNKLHELGIQFKQSRQWFLYAKYAKMGFAKERTAPYFDNEGKQRTAITLVWTETGKRFVSELIRSGYDVSVALKRIKEAA